MNKYIWIFPVLFMFHDMEEVVGIKPWLEKNTDEITSRFPAAKKLLSAYKDITTEGFALAVYEELVVLIDHVYPLLLRLNLHGQLVQ